jgi:uncharacterized protein (TIGR03067 family)
MRIGSLSRHSYRAHLGVIEFTCLAHSIAPAFGEAEGRKPMNGKFACLLVAFLPFVAFCKSADDAAKEKLASLQGVWKIDSLEVDGKPAELPEISFWWTIRGDKVLYGGSELGVLTIDPEISPKCIDLALRESKRGFEGIYSIEDNTLKICLKEATDSVRERPGEFATKGKEGYRLLVLKRDKDRKPDSLEGMGGFVGIAIKLDDDSKQVVVVDVVAGSPAEKAGLKKDDVLLKIGDHEAKEIKAVVAMIRNAKAGSELTLHCQRDGKEKDFTVKAAVVPFFLLE